MARSVEFGASVIPSVDDIDGVLAVARRTDEVGFELLGIQDHPYQQRFLDTWMLMATVLASTKRIRVFPNVANLPLRGPALIAKQAASLDVLSRGRFELGLGAGFFWDAIAGMGGPRRSPGEAVDALAEAIEIVRLFWSGAPSISFSGRFYSVQGLHPGPPPAHPPAIWIGAYKPRMLHLTGRVADGWVPSLPYAPPATIPELSARVDAGAAEAGRDPSELRRIYNVSGEITDGPARELLVGPAEHWVEELTRFVTELRFDTFVFWPREGSDAVRQLERFMSEVAPGVREAV